MFDKKNYSAEYYKTHKESMQKSSKLYYQNNKEKQKKANKEYYQTHRDEWKSYYENQQKDKNRKIRNLFLEMYGNKCSCCGENIEEFLTIEHIHGQVGQKRESSLTAYKKAISEYRPDLYETLCMNCNWARCRFGSCPHEKYNINIG